MAERTRPGLTRLGAMRRYDYTAFAKELRRAMREAGGRIPDAAAALGVSERSLYRWLDEDAAPGGRRALVDVSRADVGKHRGSK